MKCKSWLLASWLLATGALALTVPSAYAAVPPASLIEGALTATGGGPAADGTYNMTFLIYEEEVGGNPIFVEGPLVVGVKNGLFTHALGSKTKLDPAVLAGLTQGWLAIKVESDGELARKKLHSSVYALVAGTASGVECSGCIKAGNLHADALKPYAKTADLAKVATTGNFSDLNGGPDLSGYAKKSELAKVASTGQYGDIQGAPTLAKVATTGAYGDLSNTPTLADVAKSGSYADLKNLPTLAKTGAECGTGLVIKGIKADGSYDCVEALTNLALDDVTAGLMFFGETYMGKSVQIPDNRANSQQDADIAIDKIAVPKIGVATKLTVTVELAKDAGNGSSNVADKRVLLVAPDNTVYTLFCGALAGKFDVNGKPLCSPTNSDTDYPFLKVYPKPDPVLVGDLTSWVGKDPAGTWTIKVHDYGFNGNGTDGKINTWSINIHTYGSKKLNVKGGAVVEGKLVVGGGIESTGGGLKLPTSMSNCDAAAVGSLRYDAKWGVQACELFYQNNGAPNYAWVAALPKLPMFSGGCTNHPAGQDGWGRYCLNGTDFNTAQDYFDINQGEGVITFKVGGFYRFNFFAIQHGCGSKHFRVYINGAQRAYFHNNDTHDHSWSSHYFDLTWAVRKGDTFYFDAHANGCNPHRWHHWDTGSAHSRLQVEYVGGWRENSTPTF
jgi:hypothetical protein